jgi:hypothetical protein
LTKWISMPAHRADQYGVFLTTVGCVGARTPWP